MKKLIYPVSLILLCLMLSSWGSKGHRKINQNMAACLPAQMSFLKPSWTNVVTDNASEADYRKTSDPNESPRHFIDIDNYPEFIQSGYISQIYDSVVARHGASFVIDQGILPWAVITTYDSLKSCFQRGDWNKSALFAADLGHYVGDGHMPLHITRNYNGQFSGQTGIHSRYETTMVGKFETQIIYPVDSGQYIQDISGYVFDYLYYDYKYVDSVLLADSYAKTLAGSTTSDAYYQALWSKSGNFTTLMMRNASDALANLIYTAWIQAGSPRMYPNAIDEPAEPCHISVFPSPARQNVNIQFALPGNSAMVTLAIYNSQGKLCDTVYSGSMAEGPHNIKWNSGGLVAGVYFCVLKSGMYTSTTKFAVTP